MLHNVIGKMEYVVEKISDVHSHEREEHEHDEEDDEATMTAKIVSMCGLFLASLIMGCLPLLLSRWLNWKSNLKNNRIVDLLLCFGGGVLLSTTFIHILPEVDENIAELEFFETEMHIPFGEIFMLAGFFTMYFVEECVHWYLHKREKATDMRALRRSLTVRRGELDVTVKDLKRASQAYLVEDPPKPEDEDCKHNHAGHSHIVFEDTVVKSIRGLLIVLALSIHELFEGLAVGLETSSSSVWYMFGAVSGHKLVIAFCIGVELITAETKTLLTVIYVFVFAVVSPIGIGIGIAISGDQEDSTAVLSVILRGLAAGTLLYVVFFEILQKDRKGGLKQYLAVFVGFAVMLIIIIFTGHEHGHGDEHGHEEHNETHFH